MPGLRLQAGPGQWEALAGDGARGRKRPGVSALPCVGQRPGHGRISLWLHLLRTALPSAVAFPTVALAPGSGNGTSFL